MKILVLFTGGTIGSTTKGRWTSPDKSANYTLIENYKKSYADIEFEVLSPFSILSENLTAKELELLTASVADGAAGDYDGIIITHGTDTLQYSAAALALSFPALHLPVVLVSANYPLDRKESNGFANFEAAVGFIRSGCGKGVFVAYKNTGNDVTDIHYGTRLYTHLENTDEVYSLGAPYAFYKDGTAWRNPNYAATASAGTNSCYLYSPQSQIAVINSMPGDSFCYDLSNIRAVLFRPFHSGTLNTADGSLQNFCKRAAEKNIPVFVLSTGLRTVYASTRVFEDYGIKPLPLCTFVSAYMKLWIALSNGLDIEKFMKTPIAEEYLSN